MTTEQKTDLVTAETARKTTTALTSDGGGIVFQSVAEARDIAYLMSGSSLAVRKHLRGDPGACFGIVIQAVEWGMSPYAVANKSYVVNDQLAYESQLIQAVILRRAPIKGRIKFAYEGEGEDRICIASAVTLDGDTVEYRSPKFGKITPKNSPLWKNDPDQQQSYFSGRGLCRRHFPDVLMGIYDVDEMEGAEGLRDVTPKSSGLADRLAANQQTGGFDPAAVTAALGEAQDGRDASSTTTAASTNSKPASEPATAPEKVIGSDTEHDPEIVRAGATAASDGEPRQTPDDLSPGDGVAWLTGYDSVKAKKAA